MIRIGGNVKYIWKDRLGRVVDFYHAKNLFVLEGCDVVVDLLGGTNFWPDAVAIGTGTGGSAPGMTALQAEIFRAPPDRRVKSAQKITFELVLPESSPTNGFTLGETGIFTGARMLARSLISPPRDKTGSISLTIAHEIRVEGV